MVNHHEFIAMSLLRLKAVGHRYPGQRLAALSNVDLELAPGQALGVVGESGCGKSTLARICAGLVLPSQGSVHLYDEQQQVLASSARAPIHREVGYRRQFYRQVQLIFQDPAAALSPRRTILQTMAEPLKAFACFAGEPLALSAARLLGQVGLEEALLHRYPHQLSGGQRQRVLIARALAAQPRLLIADEPLSALDVSVQAQILNLLHELCERLDLALLFISHDLAAVSYLCERLLVIRAGEVIEQGRCHQLATAPEHDYTRRLFAASGFVA
jgi:ABC-type dipeptide/oligopeptide/nickel transport system ATPase subunit